MRKQSVATQSIRGRRSSSAPSTARTRTSALQVYVFRGETFLGTELFDPTRPISVGRHHDAQLRLDGETVSRYHCRFSVEGESIFVEDLDSGNGTILNHDPVQARCRLDTGAQVHVGPYSLRLKLLRAPGPRPYDPAKSEDTTKINAILAAERADRSTHEVALESNPSLDDALYKEALRRSSGGEAAHAPAPQAPAQAPMDEDSTQMAADGLVPGSEVSVPVVRSIRGDVDERLADLDRLIASLEAEERPDSLGPWKAEQTYPTVEHDEESAFAHSEPLRPLSTREFARDLASRLALDGAVVPAGAPKPRPATADVIPIRRDTPLSVPLDDDEDDTQAELAEAPASPAPAVQAPEPPLDPALLAAAEMDDTPDTELLDGLPPQVEAALPQPRVLAQPPAPPKAPPPAAISERVSAPPRSSVVAPPPSAPLRAAKPRPKGLSIPGGPRMPSWVVARKAPPRVVPSAPMVPPEPEPAPVDRAPPASRRKKAVPARLMTPTGLQVDVLPAPPTPPPEDSDSGLSDVWSQSDASVPHASILRRTIDRAQRAPATPPARSATEAKPQARMDDFSSALARLPNEAIPHHFDGVEVAARVNGQLVDISVLRSPKDEYILGHRTPQGATAPARAHVGLRLVRINDDRTVDLVFPKDVGGHLVRGQTTATFGDLSEGRKYSCLRLDPRDVATVVLGTGQDQITYHVRFLRRPKSLFRSLRGLKRS